MREGTLCVGTFRSHSSHPCFHSLISLLKVSLQQSDPIGTNQGPLCTFPSRGPWSLCGILGWREQDRVTMGSGGEAPVAPGPGQPFILSVLYALHPLFMSSCCGFRLLKIFAHTHVYAFSLTLSYFFMDF